MLHGVKIDPCFVSKVDRGKVLAKLHFCEYFALVLWVDRKGEGADDGRQKFCRPVRMPAYVGPFLIIDVDEYGIAMPKALRRCPCP